MVDKDTLLSIATTLLAADIQAGTIYDRPNEVDMVKVAIERAHILINLVNESCIDPSTTRNR